MKFKESVNNMVDKVRTGIPGFNDILNGGIPRRNTVLLSGGPGTGKSIFVINISLMD